MKDKTESKKQRSFLRLVVESGGLVDPEEKKVAKAPNENTQFEMFGRADSLVFTEVRNLCLTDIKDIVSRHHIHHILDLREVPYLNFGRSNRDSFFQYLHCNSVDYLSLISVASQSRKPSVDELLEDESSSEALATELIKWIGKGPTLVLINRGRESDQAAISLSRLLAKSNINFTEVRG